MTAEPGLKNKHMKTHTFRATGTMIVLALTAIQSLAQSTYTPYTFTTFAGGGGFVSPDVAGNPPQFNNPNGVAVDGTGNVYVADTFNHVIRKVSSDGTVTTLAGVAGQEGNVEGTGSGARFYFPIDVAVDIAGNVYVAEGSHIIRKVTPEGVVSTLAGFAYHSGSADGTGSAARCQAATAATSLSLSKTQMTAQPRSSSRGRMPMRADFGKAWWLLWNPSPKERTPRIQTLVPLSLAPGTTNRRSPQACAA